MITSSSIRDACGVREFHQSSAADEVLVVCAVGDATAQRVVIRAAVLGGGRPVTVSHSLPQLAEATRSCSAFVWDVAPWDHDAVSFLERLGRRRPDLPVLVLLPPEANALRFVSRYRRQPGVRVGVVDDQGARPKDIEEAVNAVLADLPPFVVAKELGRLRANRWLARVMGCALAHVGRGARPTVAECARACGCSLRTLERLLRAAQLPTPKELIDWATVLHIKHGEMTTGYRPVALGRAIGLTGNDVYRIRQRLAHRSEVELRTIREADFRQVLDLCTRRCGLATRSVA